MLIIGLTGGIASGKSTVSKRLKEEHNIPIIDADLIARQVVEPGESAYNKIVKHFESRIEGLVNPDGSLNRAALGAYVFANKDQLKVLNGITHPAVRAEIFWQLIKNYLKWESRVVLDVPLLFEAGMDMFCGTTVSVICNPDLQLERLILRNPHLSKEEAVNRIASQMSTQEKINRSDYVIENNSNFEALNEQVDSVLTQCNVFWIKKLIMLFPPFALIDAVCIYMTKYFHNKFLKKRV